LGVQTAEQDVARAQTALSETKDRLAVAETRHKRELVVADEEIPSKQQIAGAETEVAVARAALEQARLAWEREQRLHSSDARSRDAVADLEAAVAFARADLSAAQRRVDALGQGRQGSRGRITIAAQVSGKISARNARVGAMVSAGETLLEITGTRSVWIETGVYEKDVSLLSVGQPMEFEVSAFPGKVFETSVYAIDPGLDEHTRKATARGVIDNEGGALLPDMFANIRVRVAALASALAVPSAAVQSDGHCEFVFVQVIPGSYRRVEVQVGPTNRGLVEILGGLEEGQDVVTEGSFLLKSETSDISDSCGSH